MVGWGGGYEWLFWSERKAEGGGGGLGSSCKWDEEKGQIL
jgi:hypothetical protein